MGVGGGGGGGISESKVYVNGMSNYTLMEKKSLNLSHQ